MFSNPSGKLKSIAAWIFGIQLILIVILLIGSFVTENYLLGIISALLFFFSAWYNAILMLTWCDSADYAQQAAYQAGECAKQLKSIQAVIEDNNTDQMPTWKKVELKSR